MKDEAETRSSIRQWIVEHARHEPPGPVDDATPILESGLLSSIEVAELVLYLEHLLGAEIPADQLEANVFHSVESLWQRLFAPRQAAAAAAARKARAS